MQVTQIDWFSVFGGKQLIQKIQDFVFRSLELPLHV